MKVNKKNIHSELDENKFTVDDSVLLPIEMGLEQLRHFLELGVGDPKEVKWEIKLYEWILKHPRSHEMAELYIKERHRPRHSQRYLRSKRDCVQSLGWNLDSLE